MPLVVERLWYSIACVTEGTSRAALVQYRHITTTNRPSQSSAKLSQSTASSIRQNGLLCSGEYATTAQHAFARNAGVGSSYLHVTFRPVLGTNTLHRSPYSRGFSDTAVENRGLRKVKTLLEIFSLSTGSKCWLAQLHTVVETQDDSLDSLDKATGSRSQPPHTADC